MLCLYLDMLLYAVFLSWYASLCSVYILIYFFMLCLYLDILLYEFHISFILGFMWSVPEGGLSPHTDTHQTRNADNFLHFAYFAYFNLFKFYKRQQEPHSQKFWKRKIVSKLFCANCRLWPFSECIFSPNMLVHFQRLQASWNTYMKDCHGLYCNHSVPNPN